MSQFSLNDDQLKQQIAKQYQKEERKFPTEVIDLPSKGLVYPEGHPLRDGRVEMKYMTAKEEDILSSANLIRQGVVLDKLYESLIIGNGEGVPFDYEDLVVGDRNGIMIAARVLGYGKDYPVSLQASSGTTFEHVVDLTQLEYREFAEDLFRKHGNEVPFQLPVAKTEVTVKILTGRDERIIRQRVDKDTDQIDRSNSYKLKQAITSVGGDDKQSSIDEFVDNYLLAQDSLALRKFINEIQPDVKMAVMVEIPGEGVTKEFSIPVGMSFFWPGV